MKVLFQHLNDEDDPRNGQVVDIPAAVALLDELRNTTPPAMCHFLGDNGFSLTIGVVNDFGCIEYSQNNGLPPYLMATDPAPGASNSTDMEFVVGGTLTPIEGKYCVRFQSIKEVLLEFVQSGERSEAVNWQEF